MVKNGEITTGTGRPAPARLLLEFRRPVENERERLDVLFFDVAQEQETLAVGRHTEPVSLVQWREHHARLEERPGSSCLESRPSRHWDGHEPAVRREIEDLFPIAPPAGVRAGIGR